MDGLQRVKELITPEKDGNCTICFQKLSETHCSKMSICKHIFHTACILKWYDTDESCPLCRSRTNKCKCMQSGKIEYRKKT